jgi:hypothetical protein
MHAARVPREGSDDMSTTLQRLDTVTLLPSGHLTVVTVASDFGFRVRATANVLRYADEGATWRRGHEDRPIERKDVHRALQLGESSLELAYACTSESGVTRVYDIRASCEYVTTADQARRRGLALIAAANEADQLASDSKPATGAEFLAASAKAIEPRSDEEIAEIISDMEKR